MTEWAGPLVDLLPFRGVRLMPLLETHDLTAFYGDFQALFGISSRSRRGETVQRCQWGAASRPS